MCRELCDSFKKGDRQRFLGVAKKVFTEPIRLEGNDIKRGIYAKHRSCYEKSFLESFCPFNVARARNQRLAFLNPSRGTLKRFADVRKNRGDVYIIDDDPFYVRVIKHMMAEVLWSGDLIVCNKSDLPDDLCYYTSFKYFPGVLSYVGFELNPYSIASFGAPCESFVAVPDTKSQSRLCRYDVRYSDIHGSEKYTWLPREPLIRYHADELIDIFKKTKSFYPRDFGLYSLISSHPVDIVSFSRSCPSVATFDAEYHIGSSVVPSIAGSVQTCVKNSFIKGNGWTSGDLRGEVHRRASLCRSPGCSSYAVNPKFSLTPSVKGQFQVENDGSFKTYKHVVMSRDLDVEVPLVVTTSNSAEGNVRRITEVFKRVDSSAATGFLVKTDLSLCDVADGKGLRYLYVNDSKHGIPVAPDTNPTNFRWPRNTLVQGNLIDKFFVRFRMYKELLALPHPTSLIDYISVRKFTSIDPFFVSGTQVVHEWPEPEEQCHIEKNPVRARKVIEDDDVVEPSNKYTLLAHDLNLMVSPVDWKSDPTTVYTPSTGSITTDEMDEYSRRRPVVH
jgi:hypothetical protein